MSFSETIFLFFLALVIFGPKKLPEIARQVGKLLNEFRRASNEFKAQIEQEIAHIEIEERKKTILPPSPPVEGTASRTLNAPSTASSYPSYRTIEAPKPGEAASDQTPTTLAAERPVPADSNATVEPTPETISSSASQESHA